MLFTSVSASCTCRSLMSSPRKHTKSKVLSEGAMWLSVVRFSVPKLRTVGKTIQNNGRIKIQGYRWDIHMYDAVLGRCLQLLHIS